LVIRFAHEKTQRPFGPGGMMWFSSRPHTVSLWLSPETIFSRVLETLCAEAIPALVRGHRVARTLVPIFPDEDKHRAHQQNYGQRQRNKGVAYLNAIDSRGAINARHHHPEV
jgi:hypothetical protein